MTDAAGRQFRVLFAVSYQNGEARGRVISARPLEKAVSFASAVVLEGAVSASTLCLSEPCHDKTENTPYAPGYLPVASPYFSLDFLINSQPTRAPAHT